MRRSKKQPAIPLGEAAGGAVEQRVSDVLPCADNSSSGGGGQAGAVDPLSLIGGYTSSVDVVSSGVDWLQVTFKPGAGALGEFLPSWLSIGFQYGQSDAHPVPGWVKRLQYAQCWALEPAGYLMANASRPEQGYHLRLSGSELSLLRSDVPGFDDAVVDWLAPLVGPDRARVSRMDLYCDVDGVVAPLGPISEAVRGERHKARGAARVVQSVTKRGIAETVYIGAAGGLRTMRVYDKAREIFQASGEWVGERTRVEVVLRGDYAAAALAELEVFAFHKVVLNLAADMADFPVGWWRDCVMSGNERGLVRVPRGRAGELSDSDYEKWLIGLLNGVDKRAVEGRVRSAAVLTALVQVLEHACAGSGAARRVVLGSGYIQRVLADLRGGE